MRLDEATIERALPLVSAGLEKYWRIQMALPTTDVSLDRDFQTRFNGFYRVRRNADWQSTFYALLQRQKAALQPFADVLRALYKGTGRVEGSFASKLAASVDPGKPVIDSFVLGYLGLSLLRYGTAEVKLARVVQVHQQMEREFAEFLTTGQGRYLTSRFEECYPERQVSPVKMVDLVLWQSR